jgi:phytoene dehydrogenase-like protein
MRQYDLAVAGAGLGGLAAAALLSAKGKKTILCTPSPSLDDALGVSARDGFLFCPGPSLSYGFEQDGPFHQLLADLGLGELAPASAQAYQVALPDRRITVFANQEETLEELSREFRPEIRTVTRFYRDLKKEADRNARNRVYAYFSQRRSAAGFIRKYAFSSELRLFFNVQSLFFFQRPVSELSLATLIALCNTRPFYYYGGHKTLVDRLLGIVLQKGGDIRYKEAAQEIVIRDNRAIGIRTNREVIEAGTVLLDSQEQRVPLLFLGILDKVVPMGMARDVLYLPDYNQPNDFIALALSAQEDPDFAPPGMRALTASFHSMKHPPAKREPTGGISRLIPFLNDFLVLTDEPRRAEAVPVSDGILFKPVRSKGGEQLLFGASKRNVYKLDEVRHAPLQQIHAVRKFVQQML